MSAVVFTLLLVSAQPVIASQVRMVNLEELIARSGTVFSGRCVELQNIHDESLELDVTVATFEVERSVGRPLPSRVTFRFLADSQNGRRLGLPRFEPGEEFVLFLYPESRHGLTSTVGLGQGKFVVHRDKLGVRHARNGVRNQALLQGLSEQARRTLGRRIRAWEGRASIPPTELLDAVRALRPLCRKGPCGNAE